MANIDWGSTPEQQHATVRTVLQGVIDDLYDNGTPGFIPRVESFMSEYRGAQNEQMKQHESNTRKLNMLLVIATFIGVIVAAMGIVVTAEVARKSEMDPAKIFHSSNQPTIAQMSAQE